MGKIYNMNSRFYIKATDVEGGDVYNLDYQNIGDDGSIISSTRYKTVHRLNF